MIFEELEQIELTDEVTKEEVEKMGWWIATKPRRLHRDLNPFQFAQDEELSEDKALRLFIEAYAVGVLDVRYQVVEEESRKVIEEFKHIKGIPKRIISKEQGKEVEVEDKNIYLQFSLIAKMTQHPTRGLSFWETLEKFEEENKEEK